MTKLSNFVTRRWVTKSGEKKACYYYRQSRKKGRKLISLGSDYKEAIRKYAAILEVEVEKPLPHTVSAVYSDYMEWAKNRDISKLALRTIKDREGYWKQLKPVFEHCNINDLEPAWMFRYFEDRSSQASAKKELKFLSVMCNWAKARGKMTGLNPCTGIMQQLEVNEAREIYVDDASYQAVLDCACPLVRDVMRFTYLFANRPAETQAARFSHIEGDELVVELQKTKGKGLKEKRIPLDGERLTFINQQKNKVPRSFFIVSDENGQPVRINAAKFKKAFKEARDKAADECPAFIRFQLRDLRAKAATDIARDHGLEAARLMLGHTTQKQTAAYIRSVKGAAKTALQERKAK